MRLLVLFLALSLFASSARAENGGEDVHFAAHLGLSYAMTTIEYGFFSKVCEMDKTQSLVLSVLATNLIGLIRELAQNDTKNMTAVHQNALGSIFAATTILTFDF